MCEGSMEGMVRLSGGYGEVVYRCGEAVFRV